MNFKTPIVETERLRLRGRTLDDWPLIRDMWSDPIVTKFIGGKPKSEEDSWTKFLRMMGHWPALGFGYWIVEEKESGNAVGEVGFGDFRREMEPPMARDPEIGWAFIASAHGKGYATEAAKAAVAWGDEAFNGGRMSCVIDPGHKGSIRVAEKCGFKESYRAIYHGEEVMLLHRG